MSVCRDIDLCQLANGCRPLCVCLCICNSVDSRRAALEAKVGSGWCGVVRLEGASRALLSRSVH